MTQTPDEAPDAITAGAADQENRAATDALLEHYRTRAILLNREVRVRDATIAELTARLEVFEGAPDPEETP
jgi:hypothetical protein